MIDGANVEQHPFSVRPKAMLVVVSVLGLATCLHNRIGAAPEIVPSGPGPDLVHRHSVMAGGEELCYQQLEVGTRTSDVTGGRQRKLTRHDEIGWILKPVDSRPNGAAVDARIACLRFRFESDVTAFDRDTRRPESLKVGENGPGPEFLKLVDRPVTITPTLLLRRMSRLIRAA